jgi:hypothetical protein
MQIIDKENDILCSVARLLCPSAKLVIGYDNPNLLWTTLHGTTNEKREQLRDYIDLEYGKWQHYYGSINSKDWEIAFYLTGPHADSSTKVCFILMDPKGPAINC